MKTSGETTVNLRLLQLTRARGVGPILGRRLLETFGSADAAVEASEAALRAIRGVGRRKAADLRRALHDAEAVARAEIDAASERGVRFLTGDDEAYPDLLAELPDAPLILSVRGRLRPHDQPAWPVAIVGSRRCTPYGVEQAERFAATLATAGLTVVSGGARGVDTAAHRACLRAEGHTIAVLGCGLGRCYPPENRDLFDAIVANGGAIVSELPLETTPAPENFPARNRIISGLSLGVLVVEAPKRSGALITARIALEEHGRDVAAIPGRVSDVAAAGANGLIKSGEAALVETARDVIDLLETPARHRMMGRHDTRYAPAPLPADQPTPPRPRVDPSTLSPVQRQILDLLESPRSLDELVRRTDAPPSELLPALTMLEMRQLVRRAGGAFERL
ncbi:DNA-processing protein DprA [Pyruvatibacter sp.]|uniref:DNA-processing protein DprA n=1 Tax=Pyruvatibacter sp. TaxID=1981328 RepID=UPI0032ECB2E6